MYVIVNNKGYSFDYSDTYLNPYQNNIADVQGMIDSTVISEFTSLDQPIKWIKFEDAGLGITLEHPVGWEIERKESKFEEGPEVTISDSSSNSGEIKIAKPATIAAKNAFMDEEGTRLIDESDMNKFKVDERKTALF